MGDPAALHTALMARLDALTNIEAYNAQVPANPPAEAGTGRVYPYVVAWPSAGHADPDARTVDDSTHGALGWPVQVTVAAGDPGWCLAAAQKVRTHLEGHTLTTGAGPLREETVAPPVQRDDDVNPPRWFVPLLFRCQTA